MWDRQAITSQPRIISFLDRLRPDPPGCILLEGGRARERKSLALYWAMSLNCLEEKITCLECRSCVQITHEEFRDLHILEPGHQVKIGQVRELRTIYLQKPHFSRRVMIIAQAHQLRAEPANALLKSIEEPGPYNCFVLLAPQRQGVFPTLVSRSFILTLGTGTTPDLDPELEEIFNELKEFVRSGKGWLAKTWDRPVLDAAMEIVSRCRLELASACMNRDRNNLFRDLGPDERYRLHNIFNRAQYCLSLNQIRAEVVLEWLGMGIWKTVNQREKSVYRT